MTRKERWRISSASLKSKLATSEKERAGLMSDNLCGSCTCCCKVFAIPEVETPAGSWCSHCHVGKGCKIYETRPTTCANFECLFLESQSVPGQAFPLNLRPDKCKVVFSGSTRPDIIVGTTMPGAPDAWRRPVVRALIDRIVRGGQRVCVGAPASTDKILISRDGEKPQRMTEPDENGMSWSISEEQ